jgi:hypothetical protein
MDTKRNEERNPVLSKQLLSGPNGTRIYQTNLGFYLVDGQLDCRTDSVKDSAWAGPFQTMQAAESHWNKKYNT